MMRIRVPSLLYSASTASNHVSLTSNRSKSWFSFKYLRATLPPTNVVATHARYLNADSSSNIPGSKSIQEEAKKVEDVANMDSGASESVNAPVEPKMPYIISRNEFKQRSNPNSRSQTTLKSDQDNRLSITNLVEDLSTIPFNADFFKKNPGYTDFQDVTNDFILKMINLSSEERNKIIDNFFNNILTARPKDIKTMYPLRIVLTNFLNKHRSAMRKEEKEMFDKVLEKVKLSQANLIHTDRYSSLVHASMNYLKHAKVPREDIENFAKSFLIQFTQRYRFPKAENKDKSSGLESLIYKLNYNKEQQAWDGITGHFWALRNLLGDGISPIKTEVYQTLAIYFFVFGMHGTCIPLYSAMFAEAKEIYSTFEEGKAKTRDEEAYMKAMADLTEKIMKNEAVAETPNGGEIIHNAMKTLPPALTPIVEQHLNFKFSKFVVSGFDQEFLSQVIKGSLQNDSEEMAKVLSNFLMKIVAEESNARNKHAMKIVGTLLTQQGRLNEDSLKKTSAFIFANANELKTFPEGVEVIRIAEARTKVDLNIAPQSLKTSEAHKYDLSSLQNSMINNTNFVSLVADLKLDSAEELYNAFTASIIADQHKSQIDEFLASLVNAMSQSGAEHLVPLESILRVFFSDDLQRFSESDNVTLTKTKAKLCELLRDKQLEMVDTNNPNSSVFRAVFDCLLQKDQNGVPSSTPEQDASAKDFASAFFAQLKNKVISDPGYLADKASKGDSKNLLDHLAMLAYHPNIESKLEVLRFCVENFDDLIKLKERAGISKTMKLVLRGARFCESNKDKIKRGLADQYIQAADQLFQKIAHNAFELSKEDEARHFLVDASYQITDYSSTAFLEVVKTKLLPQILEDNNLRTFFEALVRSTKDRVALRPIRGIILDKILSQPFVEDTSVFAPLQALNEIIKSVSAVGDSAEVLPKVAQYAGDNIMALVDQKFGRKVLLTFVREINDTRNMSLTKASEEKFYTATLTLLKRICENPDRYAPLAPLLEAIYFESKVPSWVVGEIFKYVLMNFKYLDEQNFHDNKVNFLVFRALEIHFLISNELDKGKTLEFVVENPNLINDLLEAKGARGFYSIRHILFPDFKLRESKEDEKRYFESYSNTFKILSNYIASMPTRNITAEQKKNIQERLKLLFKDCSQRMPRPFVDLIIKHMEEANILHDELGIELASILLPTASYNKQMTMKNDFPLIKFEIGNAGQ